MLRFGGGFCCGKVEDVFVTNGFYACMREQFTKPGTAIYYYQVEWDADQLKWEDFRGKVLGGTDPKTACPTSLRHIVFKGWKGLGASLPNPTLGTTGCTPPPARLRLWPSAPTGSACPWSPTASVERCWLPGASDHNQGVVR